MKLQTIIEYNEDVGDVRLHPALKDLKQTMERTSEGRRADFRNYEGDLDTRYFGDWEGDDGSGDYDWQELSDKTTQIVNRLVQNVEKRHKVNIDWSPSEKNYITFRIAQIPLKSRS